MTFIDRIDAGRQLAETFIPRDSANAIILALPRGGIPLAIELSNRFNIPIDVILAKKIGHPLNSEYAIGAIAENGEPIYNEAERERLNDNWLIPEIERIRGEMSRRRGLYNEVLAKKEVRDKDVIIVDDGIATGLTMFAAIQAVKQEKPRSIAVAVPIIPSDTYNKLKAEVDAVYKVEVPKLFLGGVGSYYHKFPQLDDMEVQGMLRKI